MEPRLPRGMLEQLLMQRQMEAQQRESIGQGQQMIVPGTTSSKSAAPVTLPQQPSLGSIAPNDQKPVSSGPPVQTSPDFDLGQQMNADAVKKFAKQKPYMSDYTDPLLMLLGAR